MSSIFGAWQLNQQPIPADSIQQVIQTTAWWQPDKQGHYHDQALFLGHQLMATLPQQEKEVQPHRDALAQLYIVADARLDNRKELIARLGLRNKDLPNHELILAAYQKYGKDCVKHLIGAFAFAIWNESQQQLYLARDQMGIKPLNFYYEAPLFAFGTQKKSILALPTVKKTPNWVNIFQNITWQEQPAHSTEFQHIQVVPPAHYLIVNRNGIQIQRYWKLDIHKQTIYQKEADYVSQFQELFKQAVTDRLPSNKATGTHLSGGLDSSGITAVAHKICQQKGQSLPVFGYSVPKDFQGKPEEMNQLEENLLAFDVVDTCGLDQFYNVSTLIPRTFRQVVEEEALACDGIAKTNNVNTEYELQATAQAQGVNVLLSGFLGDELVTSFARRYFLEYLERGQYWNYFFKHKKSRYALKDKVRDFFGILAFKSCFRQQGEQIRKAIIKFRDRKKNHLANGNLLNRAYFLSDPSRKQALQSPIYPAKYDLSLKESQRNHVCRPHTSRRIEGETLAGLRFKVAYRYPMADIRLLQYVISLPMEQKITETSTRHLFRRGMKSYLPDSIRLRDMKYKGSLKPAEFVTPRNHTEKSKIGLWESIQQAKTAPFLNQIPFEQYIKSDYSPYPMTYWMLLGHLGVEGKMKF